MGPGASKGKPIVDVESFQKGSFSESLIPVWRYPVPLHGTLYGTASESLDPHPVTQVFIDCSTVAPSTTRQAAALAAAVGAAYVAAPVFGRPDAAAARKLIIPVAGPAAAVDLLLPLLEVLGRKVKRLFNFWTRWPVLYNYCLYCFVLFFSLRFCAWERRLSLLTS